MFSLFFKKKPNALKSKLEEAIKLVERATCLASSYLYEKDYEPTEAEIVLLTQLVTLCKQAHGYTGHISQVVQKQEQPRQHLS